ncbi:MAG: DUF4242 domain-containing protein [Chloroflexi bacterium]|nr:DUF4242 domain-containing protein [Chloroflexota bacterium]
MPQFIDHHGTPADLPPEVVGQIRERLISGEVDEFGEKGLRVFIGAGETYCHTEAPDAEAVRRSHEAMGVPLGLEAIVEVQVLP